MSFLQPWLLVALPLLFLPLIIHLINQWRYQTKRWGAMMFLLAANRMSRGYAKLRQWLILAMRMLAIAGLIFAIARPLASGWLGLSSGSRPDATIVILDRSPSMLQQGPVGNQSKLESGCRQLRDALTTIGSNRWVLIDSAAKKPREFERVEQLFDAPETAGTSATADLPAMLTATIDYLKVNRPGATDVWICSDLKQADWGSSNQQWTAIRDSFKQFAQPVRIHLVAFPQPATGNRSVRILDAHREKVNTQAQLVLSLAVSRDNAADPAEKVPLEIDIGGVRSQVEVELTGGATDLKDYRIPLESLQTKGWGRVTLPADSNLADNQFYFVFDEIPPRQTVLVSQSDASTATLALAAGISPDPKQVASVQRVSLDDIAQIQWEKAGLLLWQGPLPSGPSAEDVLAFIKRGGRAIFFPPDIEGSAGSGPAWGENSPSFLNCKWMQWTTPDKPTVIKSWRGDEDILAASRSGAALPVGQLQFQGYATIAGEGVALASFSEGAPWMMRVPTDQGAAYFCTASLDPKQSNVARNGIVIYAMLQRALDAGMTALGNASVATAGDSVDLGDAQAWVRLAGDSEALSTEFAYHSGVYQVGERLLALNRSSSEDRAEMLNGEKVNELFEGLDFSRVDSEAGMIGAIVQEIWRLFLVVMIIALITEAALCVPKLNRARGVTA
jgi:hypothetical protein